jgi:hypothetical protein
MWPLQCLALHSDSEHFLPCPGEVWLPGPLLLILHDLLSQLPVSHQNAPVFLGLGSHLPGHYMFLPRKLLGLTHHFVAHVPSHCSSLLLSQPLP